MTGPAKTGLIYTKYTCSYNSTYLLFCIRYPIFVSFIEFLMDLYIYDDILDAIWIADKKLLHFKFSKLGQILHVDKTSFPRPGHIYSRVNRLNNRWCINLISSQRECNGYYIHHFFGSLIIFEFHTNVQSIAITQVCS